MKAWLCPWSCSTWHSCSEHGPRALQRWDGKTLHKCRWNHLLISPQIPQLTDQAWLLPWWFSHTTSACWVCSLWIFPVPAAPAGLGTSTPATHPIPKVGTFSCWVHFPLPQTALLSPTSRKLISNPANIPHMQWAGFFKGCSCHNSVPNYSVFGKIHLHNF